jgi:SNF2 family DNA or RNA helicase
MSFLNPGLLGSAKGFEERFVKPIQRDQDRRASALLHRLVRPFVLRRRKNDVLDDLPEKTVITHRIPASPEERALYETLRESALKKLTARDKPAETRMRLLAELMRLRRAACHPELVAKGSGLESSKLKVFDSLFDELREGGHRALVFSQFVDYLAIVRARFDARGVPYQYLDGSSSAAQRERAVKAFQRGEGDAFLISL